MVNSQVVSEIVNAFKLDTNVDKIPNAIPVIEVGTKSVKNILVAPLTAPATGLQTILTTSTTNDTIIYCIVMSYNKNATCDIATGQIYIDAVLGGKITHIALLNVITLTAEKDNLIIPLPHGLKIDRGTNIQMSGTFTAGVLIRSADLYYILDEVS
jgi:hypothetical protein